MGMPNANVWGDWSTWRDVRILPVIGDGNINIKALKPRINKFNTDNPAYTQCSLSRAIDTGVVTANQQIDNSICVCGQHPDISPYAHIGLFTNHQNADDNKTPDNVWAETNQINWFFGEVDAAHHTLRDHLINRNSATEKWLPNATNSGENNTNYYINPYTYYQFKSIFLQLKVDVITGYDGNNCPLFTTYSLNEWKTTHSDKKICGFTILPCGYSSDSDNVIYYGTSNTTPMNDQCITACIMNAVDGVVDYATYCNNRNISFNVIARCVTNYYDTSSTFYMTGFDMFDGQEYKAASFTNTDTGWTVWTEIPYSAENYEKLLKMGALFGCPFTDTNKYSFDLNFLDNDLYLPVIPADGIALGEYTHGALNATNDLYDATTIRDINYNPDTPITPHDTNTYSNSTAFTNFGGVVTCTKQYRLSSTSVPALVDSLYDIVGNWQDVPYDVIMGRVASNFLVTNPIDSIVSLYVFPFEPTATVDTTVKLGQFDTHVSAKILSNQIETITFTGIDLFPRFGNTFLDYEPYTRYEIYVPFCGTVQLKAADILGHKLNVKLKVDMFTGVCTGYILADDLCIETTTGTCGVQIPITGLDTATINSNIVAANLNYKSAISNETNAIMSPLTFSGFGSALSNPVSLANTVTQAQLATQKAEYELSHIEAKPHTIGAGSPLTGWALEMNARVMIYYPTGDAITDSTPPELADLTTYGHTTGFATVETATLNSQHEQGKTNFVVADNMILNFAATETEKEMIRDLIKGGVYL